MTENRIVANNGSSIVLYTADDGNTQLEVRLENDTVWLTQSQMAELFGRDRSVITRHIKNIFKEGELDETLVCAKNAQPKRYGFREHIALPKCHKMLLSRFLVYKNGRCKPLFRNIAPV